MAFDSFSAFMVMEGHGPYVWACYAAFFLLMIGLMVGSLRRRKAAVEACRRGYELQEGPQGPQAASASAASFTRVRVSQD
ncbi:heme exporter protein D [Marinobacter sp. es.042]|jgi:heme exporter protein D|uniref:heme exporter protein CcmD n=1 Tax=Marinobacter sp. es.042 TaxID=1761794 RepID=UPI000B505148|nr:heme exporter protein CcmD [Marinobacter sp. es.042]SNB55043.1 heme exporter protein D [Marinobacter sp. es.042]